MLSSNRTTALCVVFTLVVIIGSLESYLLRYERLTHETTLKNDGEREASPRHDEHLEIADSLERLLQFTYPHATVRLGEYDNSALTLYVPLPEEAPTAEAVIEQLRTAGVTFEGLRDAGFRSLSVCGIPLPTSSESRLRALGLEWLAPSPYRPCIYKPIYASGNAETGRP